ncbi:MAG: c-type cytochrome biogenesis protein CcmI [Colwellia sp.]
MEILLIIIAFVVLLLLVIWTPFIKQSTDQEKNNDNNEQETSRDQTNVRLYHEHKSEIEKDFTDGAIDQESYEYLLAELDKSLLQDIDAGGNDKNTAKNQETKKFSIVWPVGLTASMLIFSVVLYDKQGAYQQITTVVPDQHASTNMSEQAALQQQQQQTLTYIKQLQQHTQDNPEDSEAWYNLGETMVTVGMFDGAIIAFDQVLRIEGEHADLLGAKAQAVYYLNNQQITVEVKELIDRALALDINDPSTNILLGMHNFLAKKYQQAIEHWQRVINSKKESVNNAALQEAVDEAKKRLNAISAPEKNIDSTTAAQLTVSVSLSDDIAKQLAESEDKVVFIYAIPTNGQRMPLAALKIKLSDLPTTVVLNDNQAMTPESKLSSVESVHVFAIVSNQGGAGIKPGDYKAQTNNVPVNSSETVKLVVDSLVE